MQRKRITVADLKNQTGISGPRPVLYCAVCGETSSANAGDYFMNSPDYVFRCHNRNMALVTICMVYQEVR